MLDLPVVLLSLSVLVFFFFPTYIALLRRHHNSLAVIAANAVAAPLGLGFGIYGSKIPTVTLSDPVLLGISSATWLLLFWSIPFVWAFTKSNQIQSVQEGAQQ